MCNGQPVFVNAVLHAGDILRVALLEDASFSVAPLPLPLDIMWEDAYLLVINKPAGLAVHPSALTEETVTLANGLAQYLGAGFHIVNRLDRGTSGLMVVAKSGYLHDRCRRLLHTPDFQRGYRGICLGTPSPAAGTVDVPIARASGSLLRRAPSPDGQPARTMYEVLEAHDGLSLLRLVPYTGRTHQLRVHMAAIGHPLAGDWLYGAENRALIARPALHAFSIALKHPLTGDWIECTAPLPPDMAKLLS